MLRVGVEDEENAAAPARYCCWPRLSFHARTSGGGPAFHALSGGGGHAGGGGIEDVALDAALDVDLC